MMIHRIAFILFLFFAGHIFAESSWPPPLPSNFSKTGLNPLTSLIQGQAEAAVRRWQKKRNALLLDALSIFEYKDIRLLLEWPEASGDAYNILAFSEKQMLWTRCEFSQETKSAFLRKWEFPPKVQTLINTIGGHRPPNFFSLKSDRVPRRTLPLFITYFSSDEMGETKITLFPREGLYLPDEIMSFDLKELSELLEEIFSHAPWYKENYSTHPK